MTDRNTPNKVERKESSEQYVCENNWTRRILGSLKPYRRKTNDLREEIGMQFSLIGRTVRIWMMWAGHLVRMEEGRLSKKAEVMKQPGYRNGVRPQLRWEDRVKRCKKGRRGRHRLKATAADRDRWRLITAGAVQHMNYPIPLYREQRGRTQLPYRTFQVVNIKQNCYINSYLYIVSPTYVAADPVSALFNNGR